MLTNTSAPPSDQRAGVKPISFVLQNGNAFGKPVTLKIRPTDLVRQEPSRTAVHQTMGRDVAGWVDSWGLGLPSCTISGNTGWRVGGASGLDGAAAFEQLNRLVMTDYHNAKQSLIQAGRDPSAVKLIFVDTLDNFAWSVVPTTFELRRNKSNPLLFMYNIRLQAISINLDNPLRSMPFLPNLPAGLQALGRLIGWMEGMAGYIQGWVGSAVGMAQDLLSPVSSTVSAFYQLSLRAFNAVNTAVSSVVGGAASVANSLISIASDLARVGTNVFRSISAISGLPGYIKSSIMRVASAFNEAFCIFGNSLKPRKLYEDYDDLYGASNCSSTSGGRPASMYADTNVFSMMQSDPSSISTSTEALNTINQMNRADVVLRPLSVQEIGDGLAVINSGVNIALAGAA